MINIEYLFLHKCPVNVDFGDLYDTIYQCESACKKFGVGVELWDSTKRSG